MKLYPLRFQPLFQRYIWGGMNLKTKLGKPTGDQPAAESWEVVDHADGQSIVSNGPLAGSTLQDLMQEFKTDLVGTEVWRRIHDSKLASNLQGRFPLLLKYLDAARNLSVQVHPDDDLASKLTPPDLGKTEAWYVVQAAPEAKIYAGLKTEVTKEQFAAAIETGEVEPLLHSFTPNPGDTIFIAAGTMHAIGAGLLVAEIQQASNTTYRVFDWNRVDADGKSRPLHIEQALEATHFDRGPVEPVQPQELGNGRSLLVQCEHFSMQQWTCTEKQQVAPNQNFRILTCTRGSVQISDDPSDQPLSMGESVLLPAGLESVWLTPRSEDVQLLVMDP